MIMVVSMSVTAFAAPGAFVYSPSLIPAPTVVEFKPADKDCTAELVITAYTARNDLSADARNMLERAYVSIAGTTDLTKLNSDLAKLVTKNKIDPANLAVSDLFDAHAINCGPHDEHDKFSVTIKADTLEKFVALLHMNKNGEWELVKDAKVSKDGEHLEFTIDSFSPFVIVVDNAAEAAPKKNNILLIVLVSTGTASTATVVGILIKKKKIRLF